MLRAIGVLVAFIVIIFLIRKKVTFGFALILGSGIVSLFSLEYLLQGVALDTVGTLLGQASLELIDQSLELAVLMTLIFMLAKSMQLTGGIQQLINSLRTLFSKGGILALIPAVYGLMPVPGGALFSAPSIDEEGAKFQLSKNQKNFLNVWFRHIWFPVYPISQALILICSSEFANIDIYQLILVNIPSFIAFVCIGYFFLRRFLKNTSKKSETKIEKSYSGLVFLLPPLVPLGVYAVLQVFGVPQVRSFIVGVALSLILLYYLVDKTPGQYWGVLRSSATWKPALAITSIMLFRMVFEATGTNVFFADVISSWAIPSVLIIVLLPLVLGLFTGYNLGAIALSYFLVEPFFASTSISHVGIASLIFTSSLVGYLVSPIHLCNVLSSEYLKTDTTRMYHMYLPAAGVLLIVQVVAVLVLCSA